MYGSALEKAVSKARPDRYRHLSVKSETQIVNVVKKILMAGEKMMKNDQYPMALDLVLIIVTAVSRVTDEMLIGKKLHCLILDTLENIDIISADAAATGEHTAVVRRVLGAAQEPDIKKTALAGGLILNALSGARRKQKTSSWRPSRDSQP